MQHPIIACWLQIGTFHGMGKFAAENTSPAKVPLAIFCCEIFMVHGKGDPYFSIPYPPVDELVHIWIKAASRHSFPLDVSLIKLETATCSFDNASRSLVDAMTLGCWTYKNHSVLWDTLPKRHSTSICLYHLQALHVLLHTPDVQEFTSACKHPSSNSQGLLIPHNVSNFLSNLPAKCFRSSLWCAIFCPWDCMPFNSICMVFLSSCWHICVQSMLTHEGMWAHSR